MGLYIRPAVTGILQLSISSLSRGKDNSCEIHTDTYMKYQQRRNKFPWGYKVVILMLQTVAVLYHCMKPNFQIVFCTSNTGKHKHGTEFHVALASFPGCYGLQSTVIISARYTSDTAKEK